MNSVLLKYGMLVMSVFLSMTLQGQSEKNPAPERLRVLLNDMDMNQRMAVEEDSLFLSVQSLRNESLTYQISKGGELKLEGTLDLQYGLNVYDVSLSSLASELQNGSVFHFYYQGTYFGQGSFEIYSELAPILPSPLAGIEINVLEVSCEEGQQSSVEFYGSGQGGVPPYKLSWFLSTGPHTEDLIQAPMSFDRLTDQEVSRLLVTEPLDYYVTLLVEDACQGIDKKVVHMICNENDNDDMLYFQFIETNEQNANPSGLTR